MAVEHQEDSQILLEQIMPQIAAQLRGAMGNIHTALTRLVPEEMPEGEGSTGQSAAILCQSYYRLLRLVNNLSAAPLISQTEPLETKNVELVAWLTELMHCAQPLVAHAGVRLTLRCSLTAHVAAIHPSYLERLLWNLLSNAVKYTPSGGEVTVTLRAAAGQVLLTVADSGVGIPPEQQAHLFDGYLEKLRMPPPPQGLGLGLPLCQAIARGHGGRLLLQSGPEGAAPKRCCGSRPSPTAAASIRCCWGWRMRCPIRPSPGKIWTDGPTYDIRIPALAGKDTRGNGAWRKNEFWWPCPAEWTARRRRFYCSSRATPATGPC